MMISGIINTLNEEQNIANAISCLKPWVDEIIVVDMHSTDRTVEIARGLGAQVFFHERQGVVEYARQYAVDQARGDWLIILDADEMIPASLAQRLHAIVEADTYDVVRIPRENYMMGAIVNHTGWAAAQDRQQRFFRRGALKFEARIHTCGAPVPAARIHDMDYMPGNAIIHFNYLSIRHFFEKMNRYTSVEAAQRLQRGEQRSVILASKIMLWTLWNRLVALRGYKDGWRGVVLSISMVIYEFLIFAKMLEISRSGTEAEIRSRYADIANNIIDDFKGMDPVEK